MSVCEECFTCRQVENNNLCKHIYSSTTTNFNRLITYIMPSSSKAVKIIAKCFSTRNTPLLIETMRMKCSNVKLKCSKKDLPKANSSLYWEIFLRTYSSTCGLGVSVFSTLKYPNTIAAFCFRFCTLLRLHAQYILSKNYSEIERRLQKRMRHMNICARRRFRKFCCNIYKLRKNEIGIYAA